MTSTELVLRDRPAELPAGYSPLRAPIDAYLEYKPLRVTAATMRGITSVLRRLDDDLTSRVRKERVT